MPGSAAAAQALNNKYDGIWGFILETPLLPGPWVSFFVKVLSHMFIRYLPRKGRTSRGQVGLRAVRVFMGFT